jgi:hypothetical protein
VENTPGAVAAHLFPDAARANHAIFYPDGRAASVAQVYANLSKAAGPGGATAQEVQADDDGGFVQYASARRADRQQQQDALVAMILRGSQPADQMGVGSRLAGTVFTSEMLKLLSDSRGES